MLATKAFLGKLVRMNGGVLPKNHVTRPTSCRLARSVTHRKVDCKQVGANAPMQVSKQDMRCRLVSARSKRTSFRGFSFVSAGMHRLGRLRY